jgi:hypothetical protein
MTPKTALLHIGTPKTGTTSIQECLARAETQGELGPYRYPLFRGLDRNQNPLTMLYLPHGDQPAPRRVKFPHNDSRYQSVRLRYRNFIFQQLQSSGGAIISGEVLCNRLTPSTVLQFRNDLESLGYKQFHVVLYIRDPAAFYLSGGQQMLKLPFIRESEFEDPASFRYPFRQIAENWERAFPGSLIVRHYRIGARFDVIADFSDVMQRYLGIPLPPLPSDVRRNTTLSAEAMVVMQDYRQSVGTDEGGLQFPGLDQLVWFLMSSGQRIPQTRPVLKAAVAELIRASHREDAEFMKSRYGVDLGLGCFGGAAPLASRPSWRVEDVLESVDPDIVQRLWDEFERSGPERRRPLPFQVAQRLYRAVPSSLRPARLDALLRSRFTNGSQT